MLVLMGLCKNNNSIFLPFEVIKINSKKENYY